MAQFIPQPTTLLHRKSINGSAGGEEKDVQGVNGHKDGTIIVCRTRCGRSEKCAFGVYNGRFHGMMQEKKL
jgi:hypothetical protein